MLEPGPLVAEGRDNLIYDAGPGRLLRRSRDGRSLESEAEVMRFAHDAGLPVPVVYDASGSDLVMERVEGPNMLQAMGSRPTSIPEHARTLGRLHALVHDVDAPEWLAPARTGAGSTLVHLDLHPLNVVVTRRGPVLVDWTNAGAGRGADDVAMTWLLLAAGRVDGPVARRALAKVARRTFVRRFLDAVGRPGAEALTAALAAKVDDPHMSIAEVAAMRAVVESA